MRRVGPYTNSDTNLPLPSPTLQQTNSDTVRSRLRVFRVRVDPEHPVRDKDRVAYLLNVNGENIVKVAKYCFEGFEKRKNADL